MNKVSGKNRAEKVEELKNAPFEISPVTCPTIEETTESSKASTSNSENYDQLVKKIARLEDENQKLFLKLENYKAKKRLSVFDGDASKTKEKKEKVKSWREITSSKQKRRILSDIREALQLLSTERDIEVNALIGELLWFENYAR